MNNLLEEETHLNHRLSLSSKGTNQSQSADSVATYARTTTSDTTTITNSSSTTNSQIHLHSPNDSQRNSTFLGYKQNQIETSQAPPGYISIVAYSRNNFADDNYQIAASNPASAKVYLIFYYKNHF